MTPRMRYHNTLFLLASLALLAKAQEFSLRQMDPIIESGPSDEVMIVGSNGLEELLLQGRNQERVERLGKMGRQMQTSCPSLVFSESYITTYNSPNFAMIPTLTTTCGTRTF